VQEPTPVVDKLLLDTVILATKSSIPTAQLDISKDMDIVRVTSPDTIGDTTEVLHVSPTSSQDSVGGPTSIELSSRRLLNVDSFTVIPGVTGR